MPGIQRDNTYMNVNKYADEAEKPLITPYALKSSLLPLPPLNHCTLPHLYHFSSQCYTIVRSFASSS